MRTPSYEDLSKEQDKICVLAALDGSTLVSGPPGTRKTVVAFYRAEAAAKKGQSPRLVMYNNVLYRYTGNASRSKKVRDGVNTWHSWLYSWWKSVFGFQPPEVERFHPDWDKMITRVLALGGNDAVRTRALESWGHLIIDEGQDFARGFYLLAQVMMVHAATNANGVAITVLADENQRLNADRNCCITDIEFALGIPTTRHYALTRNYRNTYEIARAASHFYCGLRTGIPQLPDGRHGSTPRLMRLDDLDASINSIVRFVANQSDLEIGVFLPSVPLQVKYFNKLSHRLKDVKGVKVQRFTSNDKLFGDASTLVFDRPGVVTVLCDQSCKGLEFDAVFIPELQARKWDPASIDHMRMQLYVLCSRARQHLTLQYSAAAGTQVPILEHFPGPDADLLEWING